MEKMYKTNIKIIKYRSKYIKIELTQHAFLIPTIPTTYHNSNPSPKKQSLTPTPNITQPNKTIKTHNNNSLA
jgi:hypothetical protein